MKNVLVLLTALVVSGALMSAATATGSADPIVTEIDCSVLDADGNAFLTTGKLTLWGSGKVTLHCIGSGYGKGSVVSWDPDSWSPSGGDSSCGLAHYGTTANWTDTVSKSGESKLWCTGTVKAGLFRYSVGVGG